MHMKVDLVYLWAFKIGNMMMGLISWRFLVQALDFGDFRFRRGLQRNLMDSLSGQHLLTIIRTTLLGRHVLIDCLNEIVPIE